MYNSLSALFGSYFGELYRFIQKVYENSVRCRVLCTVWLTAVGSLRVIHLVYSVLRVLPGRYNLCTHSLRALFGFYFGELYRSVQQVYEITVSCR